MLHLTDKIKNMKKLILLAAVALFSFSACHSNNKAKEMPNSEITTEAIAIDAASVMGNVSEAKMELRMPEKPTESRVEEKLPRQIIRTANINFQVENAEKSHENISALLKKYNAYFGSDVRNQSNDRISYSTTIRVQQPQFDSLVNDLIKESIYTNNKAINAEDVTSEFVDITARLRNKKELEQRYLTILKQASKISDILEVEQNLQAIREEIESTEGRLKVMKDQISYSTITLDFYELLPYKEGPSFGFGYKFFQSIKNGWTGLVELILGLVTIWPLLIMIAVGFYFFRRWRKSKKG